MQKNSIMSAVALAAQMEVERNCLVDESYSVPCASHNSRVNGHNGGRPAVPVSTRRKANKAARKARRAGK